MMFGPSQDDIARHIMIEFFRAGVYFALKRPEKAQKLLTSCFAHPSELARALGLPNNGLIAEIYKDLQRKLEGRDADA